MPFLGQDWRSPGWSWRKAEGGWQRTVVFGDHPNEIDVLCDVSGENLFVGAVSEPANQKTLKDICNHNTKSQCDFSDKWIYVQKESTKERHGYCTLGEAFNRLDFSSAIQDLRRFNYVAKLFQLIAKSQLTSLSGGAQKNYFNILDKIVCKVLEEHYNPRLIKELLQDLSCTMHALTKGVGKCVLVGSINVWLLRLDTIHHWQLQLHNLDIPKKMSNGTKFCDLPLDTHNTILYKFSDASDIINLGQAIPTLHMLSENRNLWRKLCLFHFSERQFSMNMVLTESGSVDWKGLYFSLQRHNPQREHYGDTLHFCRHCSILFWKDRHLGLFFKDCGHPCTAADPERALVPVSPQHFIDLFKF
ncbi:F-box only protein 25 isoform X1 [Gadus macrocephalus]|uniref:F-box only protein 25 isoform X1 n=1 Tax=Gadus macrocephalus TaxID=80720 RepID=UPI0028CB7852|nr:F-box only protein 25 isoform X1 [Gadus macrocephalus]XP_059898098.1 F-box only protein 25 isoform X1 [Gadus macrocephalus]